MKKDPTISVIMPVYNTPEQYLREAIESVLSQTFKDWELLIIDDCSNKINVKLIVDSYSSNKIKYFKNQKNSGAAVARNLGLKNAKGKYIAILDSDDIALPNRFEKQFQYLEKNDDVGVVGSWAEVFPKKEIWMPPEVFSYLNVLKFSPWLIHSSIMMRKSILEKFELNYNTSYIPSEDYHLWSRIVRYAKIANIQEVLVKYRAGEGISYVQFDKMMAQTKRIQEEMIAFLTQNEQLKNDITLILYPKHKKKLKYRVKYILYKGLWILGGKKNFYKAKMEKTKRKMKGL